MKNAKFYWFLHKLKTADGKRPRWTVAKIADEIYCGRVAVNQALNNRVNRGSQIRPKLVRFFKKQFPSGAGQTPGMPTWRDLLETLGWDEAGKIVPHGTLHVEQIESAPAVIEAAKSEAVCMVCDMKFVYQVTLRQCGPKKKTPQYRFRRVCDGCREAKAREISKEWKARKRAPVIKEEEFRRKRASADSPLLSSHEELAAALNMNVDAVRVLEQDVLLKVRNNPELKKYWDMVREEGIPVGEGSSIMTTTADGALLLDYQLQVLDWWAVHDTIAAECTAEALECLQEIQQCQAVIAKCLAQ